MEFNMHKLTRQDLFSLEKYAEQRGHFRQQVMLHKKPRRVAIGPYAVLYFEDRLTIQYQIQEMLRAEKIFEAQGIEEELAAYNPLIPDGSNLKATLMFEYPDPTMRKKELAALVGVENQVWLQVADHPKVYAIANEDLERSTQDKTASVHFIRFELTLVMVRDFHVDNNIYVGITHPHYQEMVQLSHDTIISLTQDLSKEH